MGLWKRLGRKHWVQRAIGVGAAEFLRFVAWSSRTILEPADFYERIAKDLPVILTMWHGQHALVAFLKRPEHRVKVLISRHRDGELNAIAIEHLGVGTIRGSGDHGRDFHRKGGVGAFRDMLTALDEGYTIVSTADVPKISRVAGPGVVRLAQLSGRPIYPVAMTTSRRIELDNWDRSAINLPFSRWAVVVGEPIRVMADADAGALEAARQQVENVLNSVTARAHQLADRDAPRG